ncbi:cold shock domain protein 1, partial [Prunus dulcis]
LRPRQDPRPVPFDSPRRPDQDLPVFPVGNHDSGRELDWFEPELFRRRAAASAAQTRIMSARRARTRGRGQRWGPNPPPPSPSPPPSPPVPSPPPSPPAGDNPLDMRHVLSQFTRTMATALRGRRGTESSEIKRVKNLGQKNLWAVQTQQKQNYGLLMWKEFLRYWNVQLRIESAWLPFYSRAMLIIGGKQ